jgi:hypothetical protein
MTRTFKLVTPKEHIKDGKLYLKYAAEEYKSHIPKWINQPKYVEVWAEKNAMAGSFDSTLNTGENAINVVIAPNGGWSSYTFAKDNLSRLKKQRANGKDVYIQYYGDSDPTGERMTAPDSKMVKLLTKHGIHFERIAITDKTIKDFKLGHLKEITDPNLFAKLQRDPNREWFEDRHNGKVWQIELDALQLDLKKFKELVRTNVYKHFDEEIHRQAMEKIERLYPDAEIREELKRQVEELLLAINNNNSS